MKFFIHASDGKLLPTNETIKTMAEIFAEYEAQIKEAENPFTVRKVKPERAIF